MFGLALPLVALILPLVCTVCPAVSLLFRLSPAAILAKEKLSGSNFSNVPLCDYTIPILETRSALKQLPPLITLLVATFVERTERWNDLKLLLSRITALLTSTLPT